MTAPSRHFADELLAHGVARHVEVTPGGVDDDAVRRARSLPRTARDRPRFVWLGRMSAEKRVLEFVEAIGVAVRTWRLDADFVLHGAGLLLPKVEARVAELGLQDRVRLAGPVSHAEALEAIHDADALVQTSVGFETQGLTPFEAAALGTPTVFCDERIFADVAVQPSWLAGDTSVRGLAAALSEAARDLRADPELRVRAGDRFLQSTQTERLLELYAAIR